MPTYSSYIQSAAWQKVRERILARAKGKCEKCRQRPPAQVHHKTYDNLFNERDADLIALCVPCHQREHPDKIILSPSFVGEHPCRMCPCETAEIFAGSTEVLFICTDCGDMERRARKGAKPKKSKTRRTPAPQHVLNRAQKAEAATRARWAKEQAAHEAKVRKRAQERASGR